MKRALLAGLAALVLAAGVGAAVVLQPDAGPLPTVAPSPDPTRTPLLLPAGPGAAVPPTALLRALPVKDPRLGTLSLSVVDVASGRVLVDLGGTRAATPASTAKLVTAVAALTVLGPDTRLTTRLLQGPDGAVVLVGGGDPTLDLARLRALAKGVRARRVLVDDNLFRGARTGPGWKPAYQQHGNVAPVSALELDEGRQSAVDGSPRVADPALAAGQALARLVGARSVVRGSGAGLREIARVESAPVSALVERMLTTSDNDLAEALGRQVALARQLPATFAGEARASAAVLQGLGFGGLALQDASGLSPLDRVQPRTLALLLTKAATDPTYQAVVTGLPVAGFDGTLADRYRPAPAAGEVRAKTGTLQGVSALAGLVRTRDGRLLAFAALASGVATAPAEKALDALVGAMAGCGCVR